MAVRPRAIRLAAPLIIALMMGSMLDARAAASAQMDARGSPETSPAADLQRANGDSASGRTGAASVFPLAVRPGQRIELRVDGRETIAWTDCPLLTGHVGLQAEGAAIEVRSMKFQPL